MTPNSAKDFDKPGDSGSDPGVVLYQGDVGLKTCTTGFLDDLFQDKWVISFPEIF